MGSNKVFPSIWPCRQMIGRLIDFYDHVLVVANAKCYSYMDI
jgi:hypothetical protein